MIDTINDITSLGGLNGYFHQDWVAEFGNWEEVVDQFVEDKRQFSDELQKAILGVNKLIDGGFSEEELENFFTEVDWNYRPAAHNETHRAWLERVLERLENKANIKANKIESQPASPKGSKGISGNTSDDRLRRPEISPSIAPLAYSAPKANRVEHGAVSVHNTVNIQPQRKSIPTRHLSSSNESSKAMVGLFGILLFILFLWLLDYNEPPNRKFFSSPTQTMSPPASSTPSYISNGRANTGRNSRRPPRVSDSQKVTHQANSSSAQPQTERREFTSTASQSAILTVQSQNESAVSNNKSPAVQLIKPEPMPVQISGCGIYADEKGQPPAYKLSSGGIIAFMMQPGLELVSGGVSLSDGRQYILKKIMIDDHAFVDSDPIFYEDKNGGSLDGSVFWTMRAGSVQRTCTTSIVVEAKHKHKKPRTGLW